MRRHWYALSPLDSLTPTLTSSCLPTSSMQQLVTTHPLGRRFIRADDQFLDSLVSSRPRIVHTPIPLADLFPHQKVLTPCPNASEMTHDFRCNHESRNRSPRLQSMTRHDQHRLMHSLFLHPPLSPYRQPRGNADGQDPILEIPLVQIPNGHPTRLCDPPASRQTSFVISSTVRVPLRLFPFGAYFLRATMPVLVFFTHCHPGRMLVHKPTFMAALSQNRVASHLILAMCAMSAPFCQSPQVKSLPPRLAGIKFYEDALNILFDSSGRLICEANLQTVQTLCLLEMHDVVAQYSWTKCYRYLGMFPSLRPVVH